METWIVSSFPGPISRVMALLFKTVVNIGLLLPIYFAPADFYCMMCGLIVSRAVILLTRSFFPPDLMCFFSVSVRLTLCQGSAERPCLSGWSGGSSHVKDMQLISAARGVMSLWSRRPTTAGLTTRSAMLTRSRWRTSSATSPTPTRLYHKGKKKKTKLCHERADLISQTQPGAED